MAVYTGETLTEDEYNSMQASAVMPGNASPAGIVSGAALPPAGMVSSPSMAEVDKAAQKMEKDYREKADQAKIFNDLPTFFGTPVGAVTAAALGMAAGAVGVKYAPKVYKSIKDKVAAKQAAQTSAAPQPSTPSGERLIVRTASGPIDLSEIPEGYRELVAKSAQTTEEKLVNKNKIPTLTTPEVAPIATTGAAPVSSRPTVVQNMPVAPTATPAVAPSATPVAAANAGVAPNEQAMFNWVRGQMKQRGFADLSDDAVRGFLKTFYGDAPIVPGSGAAPEGYGTKFAEWAKQNIAGPGVGMPREEMKALKARAAVAPPQTAKPTQGPESQKGSASMGAMANTALNAAGGLLLLDMFKKARETGDYSDFALGAIGQVLGNVASPAANVGYMLMQPNTLASGTLDSPEAQELMRRRNAGAGRGFVNPPQFR